MTSPLLGSLTGNASPERVKRASEENMNRSGGEKKASENSINKEKEGKEEEKKNIGK